MLLSESINKQSESTLVTAAKQTAFSYAAKEFQQYFAVINYSMMILN